MTSKEDSAVCSASISRKSVHPGTTLRTSGTERAKLLERALQIEETGGAVSGLLGGVQDARKGQRGNDGEKGCRGRSMESLGWDVAQLEGC